MSLQLSWGMAVLMKELQERALRHGDLADVAAINEMERNWFRGTNHQIFLFSLARSFSDLVRLRAVITKLEIGVRLSQWWDVSGTKFTLGPVRNARRIASADRLRR